MKRQRNPQEEFNVLLDRRGLIKLKNMLIFVNCLCYVFYQ